MDMAKIQLSPEELRLVKNANWVLTKNKIIRKVYDLFGGLAMEMRSNPSLVGLPGEITNTIPKISRGESYKGLPYVMLDYPRLFSADNIFAIRSFFWWGNYFSITLHLRGVCKSLFEKTIEKNIGLLVENNFSICISTTEWHHELEEGNYRLLKDLDEEARKQIYRQVPFLKFSVKIGFEQWDEAAYLFGKMFTLLLNAVQD
jgi:hypothetical protein